VDGLNPPFLRREIPAFRQVMEDLLLDVSTVLTWSTKVHVIQSGVLVIPTLGKACLAYSITAKNISKN